MSEDMDRQVEAYQLALPDLQKRNEFGWALVAREALVKVFLEFAEAAQYADEHFPSEQVLIRHTAEQRPIIPFIAVAR